MPVKYPYPKYRIMEMINNEALNTNNDINLIKVLKDINVSAFLDSWGPLEVIQVYDPDINMQGILVIDNTVLGPGCGGIRISPTITPRLVFEQARKMTLTCALVDVNFGGAAAGIRANPFEIDKKEFIRSFAKRVSPYVPGRYIARPDVNITQEEMAVFSEEVGDRRGATGKPENMGGIPYELGAIGLGMGVVIETIFDTLQSVLSSNSIPQDLSEAKIAIQGFDNIARTLLKYLYNKNAKIVAISDQYCTIYDPLGINVDKILDCYLETGEKLPLKKLKAAQNAETLSTDEIIKVKCDLFVPTTANKLVIDENLNLLKAKYIIEGVNAPITDTAELILHKKGVLVIPDILTTAGGAICSYSEYNGNCSESAFSLIDSRIRDITKNILQKSLETDVPPRRIAKEIAKRRILKATEVKP